MKQEQKDQLNRVASRINEDITLLAEDIQDLLDAQVTAGHFLGGRIELNPDPDDRHNYVFKVSVAPSFPIDLSSFVNAYGWMKLNEGK